MNQTLNYDLTTFDFFPMKEMRGEAELMQKKWWDYRMIHPMQATELFSDAYVNARKKAFARRMDKDRAEHIKPIEHEHFLESQPAVITGMWRARRMADTFGVRYDFWCNAAMRYAERRDWKNMPNAYQLYGGKPKFEDDVSMVEFITGSWNEMQRTRFLFSTNEYYTAEFFTNDRVQLEHIFRIIKHIENGKTSQMRRIQLAQFVYDMKLIPIDIAEKRFGKALLESSQAFASEL